MYPRAWKILVEGFAPLGVTSGGGIEYIEIQDAGLVPFSGDFFSEII